MTRASNLTTYRQFCLHLLGSFRIEWAATNSVDPSEAQLISLPTRKIESLLAYIALHPEPHAREKLTALIWGDSTDEQARNSLRNALSVLRKQLHDDLLIVDRETVQVSPGFPLWIDAVEFKKQAAALLAAQSPALDQIDL